MRSIDLKPGAIPGDSSRGAPRGAPLSTRLAVALLLLACVAFVPAPASAQWALRARLDNDAYTFWQHPARRTDKEYSNGVRLSAEAFHAPWWARRLATKGTSCEMRAGSKSTCLSHELAIGQDIYTPDLTRAPFTVADWEQERPYAAWLYFNSTARFARPRTLDELEVNLGVTGRPALGELAQSIAHKINQRYTNEAHGWETQVGFEPGVLVRYRRSWLAAAGAPRGLGVEAQPFIGAAAGNILSNAEAGLQLRVGAALSHPWHVPSWAERAPLEVFLLAGVRQEYVAHNFSLDGNVVNAERAVERVPAVAEHSLGLGIRVGRVTLAWRAVSRGREYKSGPGHHSYGIMQGSVELIP